MKLSSCSALHYLFLGSEAFQNNVSAELLIKGAKPFGLCVRHAGNPLVIYNCLPFSWEGITADPQMHTLGLIMVIFIFAHEYFISKMPGMIHHWTPFQKPSLSFPAYTETFYMLYDNTSSKTISLPHALISLQYCRLFIFCHVIYFSLFPQVFSAPLVAY